MKTFKLSPRNSEKIADKSIWDVNPTLLWWFNLTYAIILSSNIFVFP